SIACWPNMNRPDRKSVFAVVDPLSTYPVERPTITDVVILTSINTKTTFHTFRESPHAAITENEPVLSVSSSAFFPPSFGVIFGAAFVFWFGFTAQSAGFPERMV